MPDYQSEMRHVTGIYNIHSQQLKDQYEKGASDMRLLLCVDGETNTIWGGFELPEYNGVLRIQGIPEDLQMTFGWRARDDEGRLHFGGSCQGKIELFGEDQVRGTLYNMYPEPVYFAGRRRPGPLWCGRSVYSFKQEWDGFPKEAYGR